MLFSLLIVAIYCIAVKSECMDNQQLLVIPFEMYIKYWAVGPTTDVSSRVCGNLMKQDSTNYFFKSDGNACEFLEDLNKPTVTSYISFTMGLHRLYQLHKVSEFDIVKLNDHLIYYDGIYRCKEIKTKNIKNNDKLHIWNFNISIPNSMLTERKDIMAVSTVTSMDTQDVNSEKNRIHESNNGDGKNNSTVEFTITIESSTTSMPRSINSLKKNDVKTLQPTVYLTTDQTKYLHLTKFEITILIIFSVVILMCLFIIGIILYSRLVKDSNVNQNDSTFLMNQLEMT